MPLQFDWQTLKTSVQRVYIHIFDCSHLMSVCHYRAPCKLVDYYFQPNEIVNKILIADIQVQTLLFNAEMALYGCLMNIAQIHCEDCHATTWCVWMIIIDLNQHADWRKVKIKLVLLFSLSQIFTLFPHIIYIYRCELDALARLHTHTQRPALRLNSFFTHCSINSID